MGGRGGWLRELLVQEGWWTRGWWGSDIDALRLPGGLEFVLEKLEGPGLVGLGFLLFTSIHSPKGLLLSAALLALGLGVDTVGAMLGWMTVGQSFVLCPIQPHSMHIDDMPSY